MVRTCLDAAKAAESEGRSVEVVDLRTISPLDVDTVAESVGRTGRLVVVHEAPVFFGLGACMSSRTGGHLFHTGAKRDLLTAHSGLDAHFRAQRNLARALADAGALTGS